MILDFLPEAVGEIRDALAYYRSGGAGYEDRFERVLTSALEAIQLHPERFPLHEHADIGSNIRIYLLGRLPYSVVYRVRDGRILVVALEHLRRKPGYWRRRLRPADDLPT